MKLGDFEVNRLGFGAMRVCGPDIWGDPKDREAAKRVLRRAFELGQNFFDTADSYGPGVSEELIAEALYPYPKGLVIGTKGGLLRPHRHAWIPDARPEHLRAALDGSLKRLRIDCIDLYQLHAPDPRVRYAESVGILGDMQRAGKIRHIGLSNVSVAQLNEARRIVSVASVQNCYNLQDRSSEDVLEACERLGIPFLPWYPLNAGAALRLRTIRQIAARHKATSAQVVLAWLLAKSPVTLPIPGTGSIAHLEENAASVNLKLTSQEVTKLTESRSV